VAGLDVIKRLRGGWLSPLRVEPGCTWSGQRRHDAARAVPSRGGWLSPLRAVPSRAGRIAAAAAPATGEEAGAAARLAWLTKQGVPAWGYVGRAFTDDLPAPAPPAGASPED
jgi:hypothetical protein